MGPSNLSDLQSDRLNGLKGGVVKGTLDQLQAMLLGLVLEEAGQAVHGRQGEDDGDHLLGVVDGAEVEGPERKVDGYEAVDGHG